MVPENVNHQGTKAPSKPIPAALDEVARQIVDSAFSVHSALGPGLLESVYEVCLVHELTRRGLRVSQQVAVPVIYDGLELDGGLRLDLVVANSVIVELKTVDNLAPVHHAQVLTYMKLTGYRLGFLINFNVAVIKNGIKRIAL